MHRVGFLFALVFVLISGSVIPVSGQVSVSQDPIVTVKTQWNYAAAHAGDERLLAVQLHIQDGYHINPNQPQVRNLPNFEPYASTLTVTDAPVDAVGIEQPVWPVPHPYAVEYAGGKELMVYEGATTLFVKVKVLPNTQPGEYPIQFNFHYQACTETFCAPPANAPFTATLKVVSADDSVGEPTDPALFDTYGQAVTGSGTGLSAATFDFFGVDFDIRGDSFLSVLLILVIAGFGGFLLNFTPCVLPVIPIKIMGLAQHTESRTRTLLLGGIMAAGVIAFWLAMGVLIAMLKTFDATNELFGLPWFTISVGAFIALMAVGMMGLFTVQLPQAVYMVNPSNQTAGGSFVFGVMTAVLSLPCTAPFMGSALGWSTQQSLAVALLTFLAIGTGMALPYFVLSANPKLVDWMPRTGPASELLKQVMGLLMLAAAVFFIGTGLAGLLQQAPDPPTKLYWWPVMGLIAAAGIWLAWRTMQMTRKIRPRVIFGVIGLIAVTVGIYGGLVLTNRGPINWQYYTPERLQTALDEGNIVVVDFTAEWCLNCKALEQTQLHQDQVADLLNGPGVVPMKVDITGHNPQGRALLKEAGRLTIPLLAIYAPDGEELFKSDAYQAGQVVAAIEQGQKQTVMQR